jgi:hypothetical protein
MGADASLCEVAAVKHRSFRHEVQRAGVLLAWLAAAGVARAQGHDARLRLTTLGTCVTESGIAAGVHQRSDEIAFVARAGVPVFEVAVSQRGREIQAELQVRWPDGRSAQRTLTARSCQQLTAAVALVISMTLDPAGEEATRSGERAPRDKTHARDRPDGRAPTASNDQARAARDQTGDASGAAASSRGSDSRPAFAPPRGPRDGAGPVTESGAREPPQDSRPAARGAVTDVRDHSGALAPQRSAAEGGGVEPRSAAGAAPHHGRAGAAPSAAGAQPSSAAIGGETPFFRLDEWSIGAQGTLAFGPAPRALPGAGAYLWLAWHGAPPWSPALRADFDRAWLDAYAANGGKADFALTSAGLELCPLGLHAGPFSGYACASARLGALAARGTDTYRPASHTQLWSAFGAALLANARVTSWAEVQLGSALRAPARRDRFAFAPDVFHRVGWIAVELRASLGVRFP